MSVKVRYALDEKQLDDVEASLSITMRIRDWKQLAEQMGDRWPNWQVKNAINEVVRKARATFHGEVEE